MIIIKLVLILIVFCLINNGIKKNNMKNLYKFKFYNLLIKYIMLNTCNYII